MINVLLNSRLKKIIKKYTTNDSKIKKNKKTKTKTKMLNAKINRKKKNRKYSYYQTHIGYANV